MFKVSFFAAALLMSKLLIADSISLGLPRYGGTGCPTGSVGMVLSPDSSQLSVLFDAYTVEANSTTRTDRKFCNMAVPIHVPTGYSISIIEMDYRGFSSVPEGASADLDVDTFFAGVRNNGPRHHGWFKPKAKGNFCLANKIDKTVVVWSPCGKDLNLNIVSMLSATTNTKGEQTLAAVDSLDLAAGLTYQIQWQSCTMPEQPKPQPPPPGPVPHPGPMQPPGPPHPPGPMPMPRPHAEPHRPEPPRPQPNRPQPH